MTTQAMPDPATPDTEARGAHGDMSLPPMKLNSPVIETGRLLLRPPHENDLDDLVRLADNRSVASMLGSMPHPYTSADAAEFLARNRAGGKGDSVYAITLAGTGEFMGVCALHEDKRRFELPFIGYWLGQPYWGFGYATEAARGMVDLFFKVTSGETLMISCRVDNPASRRVIEKCGGRYWKSGEAFNRSIGETQKLDHFRIDRSDWMRAAAE